MNIKLYSKNIIFFHATQNNFTKIHAFSQKKKKIFMNIKLFYKYKITFINFINIKLYSRK